MTRLDTLRLLLAAETPDTVEHVDALLSEISLRRHDLEEGSDAYANVGRRVDELLEQRRRLVEEQHRDHHEEALAWWANVRPQLDAALEQEATDTTTTEENPS